MLGIYVGLRGWTWEEGKRKERGRKEEGKRKEDGRGGMALSMAG
jgi:hypothetical protein